MKNGKDVITDLVKRGYFSIMTNDPEYVVLSKTKEYCFLKKILPEKENPLWDRVLLNKAAQLIDELKVAAQSLGVRASVAQNSKTFPRQALDETVQSITQAGPVGQLLEGSPVASARSVLRSLTGRSAADQDRQIQSIYTEIAKALTGPRGKDAIKFIQELERAANKLAPQEAAIRRLVRSLTARSAAISQPPLQNR